MWFASRLEHVLRLVPALEHGIQGDFMCLHYSDMPIHVDSRLWRLLCRYRSPSPYLDLNLEPNIEPNLDPNRTCRRQAHRPLIRYWKYDRITVRYAPGPLTPGVSILPLTLT